MLTGHPSFTRGTAAETIAAILKEDPPQPLPSHVPPALARIVLRCMEKAREARFQSARDLAFALEFLTDSVPAAAGVAVPTLRRKLWSGETIAWAIAALAVLAAAMVWTRSQRSEEPDVRTHVLSVTPPEGVSPATEEAPAISPDGRQLAFVGYDASGKQLLFTRALDTATVAQPRQNTDGASLPFWAPNSQAIGFFAEGKLKTLDVATGRIQTLTDAGGPRGGTWNQDNEIVYVPRPIDGPYRIPATGGEPTRVAMDIGPGAAPRGWFPSFLPDGRRFLVFVSAPLPENSAVFVASLDSSSRKRLMSARSNAVYVQPGYLLFWREATLVAQPFDAKTLELQGKPITVATAVGLNPITNQSLFSVSNSGTLVFFAGAVGQSELVWVDRAGAETTVTPEVKGAFTTMSLSPDGTSVVYDKADVRTATMDLWRLDFARGVPSRLTFHPGHDLFPLWSPMGTRIVFTSLREGPPNMPNIYELDANGGGNDKLVFKSSLPTTPSGWSADGLLLIYTVVDPKTSGDIWALPFDSKQPYPVVNSAADERYGTLSPDGRWLAYASNETGPYEVYVRAFGQTGLLRQVTTHGGFQPQWRSDGRELFYLAPDTKLMAIDFRSSPATFDAGPPKALFATRTKWIEIQATSRSYAAAPDGQRFLLANATEEARSASITVVLNWMTALRK
jgi:Tol biopolymer transport system component